MGKFKSALLFSWMLLIGLQAMGQNRYAIHYKYKPQDFFTLEEPVLFLTSKALERRDRQGIALDSLDLPVSQKYIDQVSPFVKQVLYHSNWLNASIVIADQESIEEIKGFDFVDHVVLAAPGYVPEGKISTRVNGKSGINKNSKGKTNTLEAPFDYQNSLLGIHEMHEEGFRGKGVTIAVFDAGFPGVDQIPGFSHLFENNQLLGTKDFVHVWNKNVYSKNQHGTNVLSLLASDDPELLLSGAPEADYILCITEEVSTEYRIEEYNWVKAAEFADSLGVDIINSSLGYWDFDDESMNYTFEDLDGESALVSKGASLAGNKGILVVTSAGNYGNRGSSSITAPADSKGILSVGATNVSMERASFSSQGPTFDGRIKPEVSTYGEQVWLLRSSGNLGRASGTSFSSPQIAALAAGLWQARPEWTKDELIGRILESSSLSALPDNSLGYGIPNFFRALYGEILSIDQKENEEVWKIFPNPLIGTDLFVRFGNQTESEFYLIDIQGKVLQRSNVRRASLQDPYYVPISVIPSGVYIVEMQAGSEVRRTKLIKR
ncbi:T9SS C-terminal target domain-containing protein [Cyclobacteriaceae bacterium YHN15]|nr:T9SS C-terminal target domain-containing protein [Cyclobacteriaceae bacterium YHN15]